MRAARSLMQRERRRTARVAVHANASLDYSNVEKVPATLLDLSEEGTAVQSEKKLPPDCRAHFEFALPGHTSLVRLAGEVVWQDFTGRVGMRFVNVPSSSRKVLPQLAGDQRSGQSWQPLRKVPRHETILRTALPTPPESGGGSLAQRSRKSPDPVPARVSLPRC
mgnify:CR=1 FL=1